MTRIITKKIFNSVMAFFIVGAMMIGGTTVFAAKTDEENVVSTKNVENSLTEMATARGIVYSSNGWQFRSQKDTTNFSVNAGQSVSFTMGSLSSVSPQAFSVKLCRVVNGVPQTVSGPIYVEPNRSYGSTITFNVNTSGTYLVRCERTNDGQVQIINNVSVNVQ